MCTYVSTNNMTTEPYTLHWHHATILWWHGRTQSRIWLINMRALLYVISGTFHKSLHTNRQKIDQRTSKQRKEQTSKRDRIASQPLHNGKIFAQIPKSPKNRGKKTNHQWNSMCRLHHMLLLFLQFFSRRLLRSNQFIYLFIYLFI